MKEGECFGDWAILNKNLKPSLAVASEETDIFYLDKEFFIDFFSKSIIKSENDRKSFLKQVLQPMTSLGFEDFYNKITPIVKKILNNK